MPPNVFLDLARRHNDRDRRRQYHREYNRARRRGLTLAQYRSSHRAQLICCGVWQSVTTLPHVCTQCGRRYLEVPDAQS